MKKVKKTFTTCWLTTCDTVLLCLYDPTKTVTDVGWVPATIQDSPVTDSDGNCTYEFCYDEALLDDPSIGLTLCDIKSVERLSCLIEYILSVAAARFGLVEV